MQSFGIMFLVISLTVVALVDVSLAEEAGARVIRSVRIEPGEAPVIDGKLDDRCWSKADRATGFVQLDPVPGGKSREATNVYVLFDKEKLYVGFECLKENPKQIFGSQTRRDSEFFQDDYAEVFLDTYHDRRNCYGFAVNCLGTQSDRRIANEGSMSEGGPFGDRAKAWDCAWDAKVTRTDNGWIVEMAIPFSELRFSKEGDCNWGINFIRANKEFNERYTWADVGQRELCVSRFGILTGLTPGEFVTSRSLEFKPYATIKPQISPEREIEPKEGLDIRYPSSTVTADFTLNPDFAQIEADPEQINLSDVEMRLPEKRPFFQEGMELFQTPIELFYTRRVGITDLSYGMKAVGKVGSTSVALLGCQSNDSRMLFELNPKFQSDLENYNISEELRREFENNCYELSQNAVVAVREKNVKWRIVDGLEIYDIKKEEGKLNVYSEDETKNRYVVFRTQMDIGSSSSVGFLGVNKREAYGYNRAAGFDFNITLPMDMRLMGQYAYAEELKDMRRLGQTSITDNLLLGKNDDAFIVSLDRRTRGLFFHLHYGDVGRDFEAEPGYVPRTDRRGFGADSGYEYSREDSFLKMLRCRAGYERLENHGGIKTNEEREIELMAALGDFFVGMEPKWYQHTDENDESILYTDRTISLFPGWFPPRWASLQSHIEMGKQDNKKVLLTGAGMSIMPSQKLKFDLGMDRLDKKGEIFTLIRRLGANYQFSQKMSFRVSLEMTKEKTIDGNIINRALRRRIFALYSWEFRPKSNLFLVYTDNKDGDFIERIIFWKISCLLKWRMF